MRNILIQSKIIMILDEIGLSIIAGQRQAERTVLTRRGVSRILADFFVCPHYHYADFLLLSHRSSVPMSEANNPVLLFVSMRMGGTEKFFPIPRQAVGVFS